MPTPQPPSRPQLADWVEEARRRTLELVADLSDAELRVPQLSIINPFLWEIGHVAWFQERWVLRHHGGEPPLLAAADSLYDSAAVHHDTRWDLHLPARAETVGYLERVRDRVAERLRRGGEGGAHADAPPGTDEAYFNLLAVFHEDMHGEAFTYTRQTLGYPAPRLAGCGEPAAGEADAGAWPGDVEVPGGTFALGPLPGGAFTFDNEQWQHPVEIEPFSIARAPVTQGEFAAFTDDGGYRRHELWSEAGWAWRQGAGAEHPLYWRLRPEGGWQRRVYDRWRDLEPHRPAIHVNAHEAEAYCRWAGRRLPTEAEWEAAAIGEPEAGGRRLAAGKRLHPWGDEPPTPGHANLDSRALGTVDVGCAAAGDSAFGCRQMLGNVWEWTATRFAPYPGFAPGPYQEYSAPWFGSHRVLRGGAWTSRSRMVGATYRNFYPLDRRDVLAGFRTCAAAS